MFEGERAYGGRVFRGTAHSERLKNSANILDFEIPYSVAEIDAAKQLVIDGNNLPNAYLRPIAWRGIDVIERRITPEELDGFAECFITGTAAEVTPVAEIAEWKFTPGRICELLMADYAAEVQPKGNAVAA